MNASGWPRAVPAVVLSKALAAGAGEWISDLPGLVAAERAAE